MAKPKPKKSLLDNSRFYIVASTILLSVFVASFLRSVIPDNRLYSIRLEEVFGLLSVLYWYSALLITPLTKVVGQRVWAPHVNFARRALGVSAAYFALLHVGISIIGQLGGWRDLGLLPARFQVSLLFGGIAALVLLAMMATSLDVMIRLMTFRYWKWLHRLGYGAGVLAILHIWLIGSHVGGNVVQLLAFEALVLLFGLESIRLGRLWRAKGWAKDVSRFTALAIFLVLSFSTLAIHFYVKNYATDHAGHAGQLGAPTHDHP